MNKQYGLIIPNKSKLTPANTIKRPSIFDEDSDTEGEMEKPTGIPTVMKRQDRVMQKKAVEEDPTVYQYDEIYDKMETEKKESKLSRKELDKKPKYITKLLAAAEKRKRENERRIERQVQKEREAEGDEFKDKESFVTMAYKKKLEELKKLEEEEKREEYLESIGDVTKQGNLDGFYRHLYDQKVNYADKINSEEKPIIVEEGMTPPRPSASTTADNSDNESKSQSKPSKIRNKRNSSHKRRYRKHESSESNGEDDQEKEKKRFEHLPSNIDADSDFSIDSDTEESGDESKPKKCKIEEEAQEKAIVKDDKPKEPTIDKIDLIKKEDDVDEKDFKKPEEIKPKKPKIDIWKKRTVGGVFDEALQRYFERKALREAAK